MISNKIRRGNRGISGERKFTLDFSKIKKIPFHIKPDSSYNAYLSNGSLTLGLKKSNRIVWVDIPGGGYKDHVIEAKFRLESLGGYAATGIIFHILDERNYYLALVSSKGYFRLDVIKESNPKTLVAWSEVKNFNGVNVLLKIITLNSGMIFIVNNKWVCEVNDKNEGYGTLGFALASYETSPDSENDDGESESIIHSAKESSEKSIDKSEVKSVEKSAEEVNKYASITRLDYFSVDSRMKFINECFKKWTDEVNINAEERLKLAETYAVMGEAEKSIEQIIKAWKRRDIAIRSVTAADSEIRTKKELLLAARMSYRLGKYAEADEYIDVIIGQWPDSAEGKLAFTEKMKILYELKMFAQLKEFVLNNPFKINKDIDYYTLLALCNWEMKAYKESADAWNKAFELNADNGVYAVNAANALEIAGNKKEALKLYINAAKIFLKDDNRAELDVIMPKLTLLGNRNWEARALTGKWAYSREEYDKCIVDFEAAENLWKAVKPRPAADPALYYLWGLVLNLKGKNKLAIRMLEKAVKLAPDYGLFRFKLAEIKIRGGVESPSIASEFKRALEQTDDPGGKMAEIAGNLLLSAGDAKSAKYFFGLIK